MQYASLDADTSFIRILQLKMSSHWKQSHFDLSSRGEWGKLSHQESWATPLNSIKKAGEKMFMSSIVWSYSRDLLHHAALKNTLWYASFKENFTFSYFS